jgi:hypothetical protein
LLIYNFTGLFKKQFFFFTGVSLQLYRVISNGTHDYVFQCNNCVDVGEEAIEASFAEVSTRS